MPFSRALGQIFFVFLEYCFLSGWFLEVCVGFLASGCGLRSWAKLPVLKRQNGGFMNCVRYRTVAVRYQSAYSNCMALTGEMRAAR